MTYNVFGGTLNLALSIYLTFDIRFTRTKNGECWLHQPVRRTSSDLSVLSNDGL